MRAFERILITSALPYANGPLHIGHLAGAYLPADIYARFQRLMEKDVVFVCGSDEHGAAITIKAKKEETSPKEIVDKYHELFQDSFQKMGISFDIYHRTSSELHHQTSQDFFRKLYNDGVFNEKESEQYYDEKSKQFLADRYITGECPKCGNENAYGDQCENCGSSLSPTELINPKSTLSGETPILKKTTHWYLPLDKNEEWLREWIKKGELNGEELHDPKDWKNHVVGQCLSWLDGGLQERAMTRDLEWGVDVPQEIPGSEGKKLYVWMDAPIGYISATKQWAEDQDADWEPYWKSDDTKLVHFIGKDNIVFHCIIFPAILKSHGDFILPENVPANQFMNLEGRKISTSKNWAVWVHEYLEEFPDNQDELRYYMAKIMPENRDSEFTWNGFQEAVNNELVNNLANFVNRVIVLTNKYYDGIVPDFDESIMINGADEEDGLPGFHETELIALHDLLSDVGEHIRAYNFREALTSLLSISGRGNQLLQFNEPWKLIKEDEEAVMVVMNLSLQFVAALRIAIRPFMPFTSDKLSNLLNLPKVTDKNEFLEMMDKLCEGFPILDSNHKIEKPSHLFNRWDDEAIQKQIDKLKASEMNKEVETVQNSDIIEFDDFLKVTLKTGTIIHAEKVENADKLLKLTVDMGDHTRTIVSGIAEHYQLDDVINNEVSIVTNLAQRKIRGVVSQGMILMAEDSEGRLCFVSPDKKWENGSTIR